MTDLIDALIASSGARWTILVLGLLWLYTLVVMWSIGRNYGYNTAEAFYILKIKKAGEDHEQEIKDLKTNATTQALDLVQHISTAQDDLFKKTEYIARTSGDILKSNTSMHDHAAKTQNELATINHRFADLELKINEVPAAAVKIAFTELQQKMAEKVKANKKRTRPKARNKA